jgi:hypothetical protein
MKIPWIDIAKIHLEEAIVQHFDNRNFLVAITLAGVSEEIRQDWVIAMTHIHIVSQHADKMHGPYSSA